MVAAADQGSGSARSPPRTPWPASPAPNPITQHVERTGSGAVVRDPDREVGCPVARHVGELRGSRPPASGSRRSGTSQHGRRASPATAGRGRPGRLPRPGPAAPVVGEHVQELLRHHRAGRRPLRDLQQRDVVDPVAVDVAVHGMDGASCRVAPASRAAPSGGRAGPPGRWASRGRPRSCSTGRSSWGERWSAGSMSRRPWWAAADSTSRAVGARAGSDRRHAASPSAAATVSAARAFDGRNGPGVRPGGSEHPPVLPHAGAFAGAHRRCSWQRGRTGPCPPTCGPGPRSPSTGSNG